VFCTSLNVLLAIVLSVVLRFTILLDGITIPCTQIGQSEPVRQITAADDFIIYPRNIYKLYLNSFVNHWIFFSLPLYCLTFDFQSMSTQMYLQTFLIKSLKCLVLYYTLDQCCCTNIEEWYPSWIPAIWCIIHDNIPQYQYNNCITFCINLDYTVTSTICKLVSRPIVVIHNSNWTILLRMQRQFTWNPNKAVNIRYHRVLKQKEIKQNTKKTHNA
jgi:hypothetical protein